ncbi:polyhydroxyalkanoic acid system protein [Pseudomonas parafulva]|uniref:Polyhydroxyalkanoic acid system protein n=2 Tax=Pseudomonas parafulva TaxID=157782 RepID=A0ABN4XP23_9PSED|nr:polyhydroxyalkanoic acid system protein [Pseudomonas parafulva]
MPPGGGGHNADYVYMFRNTRMTQISVERKHTLGRDAARSKAQALVDRLSREYDLKASWDGDRVDVARSGANGSVHIGQDSIRVDLKLGMMMSMMSGTIKGEIERALDKALA